MRPHFLPSRFLSLALALLVLVASIGLPVQRRTCRLSGRSTARIAWNAAAAGRSGPCSENPEPGVAAACYAYSLQLHQLSLETAAFEASKLLPAPADWLALPAGSSFRPPATPRLWAAAWVAGRVAGRPPPPRPAGRALLVRIGLLVV